MQDLENFLKRNKADFGLLFLFVVLFFHPTSYTVPLQHEVKHMPYCNHCGRYIEDGTFCDWCQEHAPKEEGEETPPAVQEDTTEASTVLPQEEVQEETEEVTEKPKKKRFFAAPLRHYRLPRPVRSMLDTPDTTSAYTLRDARDGKGMSCLCYLWILWVIPFFAARKSPFVRYHLGQGLMLLLMDCLGATFFGIAWVLGTILPVSAPAFAALGEVALLLSCLLKVFGIVCALQGKAKELPSVGTYGRNA